MSKEIQLFATRIPYTEEELEDNEVYVEFNVKELLDQIDDEDISDYARWNFDMKHEDDFESSLDDFDEGDLIKELESRGHNFSNQIGEKDCIEFLEDSGYTVTYGGQGLEYDYVDNCLFEDISSVFYSLSCAKRQELRDMVINNFK